MKRSSILATIAASIAISATGVATASAETLRQAMTSAYNHSGLLEQNRALLRAADEDVAQAAAALMPVVNWSSFARRDFSIGTGAPATNSMNVSLNAQITLYDGGANKLALEAAKESVLATRQSLISVEQQVLFTAVEAFMNLIREAETVALRENNLRVIKEELRAAQDRFDVGEITKTDVALAEARLAASESALAAARGSLAAAKAVYREAVGKRAGQLTSPKGLPSVPANADAAAAIAVQTHPELKRLQHDIKAADLNVARVEKSYEPKVTLGGSLSYTNTLNSPLDQKGGSLSLNASGPIYSGGQIPSLIRKTKAQRDAARAGLHLARHQIERQVYSAYALLDVARASRVASEQQIRAAQVAFRGIREEATLGSRTTLDVLNAENELLDARAAEISAITDEYIAAYRLLAQMGRLTVDVLNLPVQKYDPTTYYNLVKDAPAAKTPQGQALDRVLKSLGKN